GMLASIFAAPGANFGKATAVYSDLPKPIPFPKALADIQVLVNGVPAPLTYVGPGQVNFMVPVNTSTSGPAEIQVLRVSTGQLMAISGSISMNTVSPGIFEITGTGPERQAAVINGDGVTVNSSTTP